MDLLGSDSEDEKEIKFKINENYAKNYDKWRKKEEKQKLLDRYGNAETSSSSSEDEEIRSTPQMDKDWLRAYAVIRFQQPRLYKKGEHFFSEEAKPVRKKKEKAVTLKDHERRFMLEKGGLESDDDSKPQQALGKSYFEEQEEIKESFKDALQGSSDEDDGLLVKKPKTLEEQRKEENDYLEWLKGEKDELLDEEAAAELAPLKAYWNDPNLSEKERVLRDYILNNGYIDQEDSSDESAVEEKLPGIPNFEGEEEFLEKAEEYEHKYNFRHEEPGGDEIKSYPRVIETSVRIKDTRRAEQRQKKLEKKRQQKEEKREEIRLLQKLQMEERQEKLEKLRKIANNPELDYDLEAEFDPEEHNKIMQKFFSEDYYGENNDVIQKPHFDYDEAIDEEPDDWWQHRLKEEKSEYDEKNDKEQEEEGGEKVNGEDEYEPGADEYEPGADDPDFIMDADYDPTRDYKAEKKKNKKKRNGLPEKLPLFDPSTKTFDEYIDEYLRDKIDTIPFTYREVVPNDFGLTTEEILKAPERELNTWVSVKKMSQYRSKQEEISERRKFLARAKIPNRKLKVLPSLSDKESMKTKKKKKRKKQVASKAESEDGQISNQHESAQDSNREKRETITSVKELSNTIHKGVKRKRQNSCVSLNEVPEKKAKLKSLVKEIGTSHVLTKAKKADKSDMKGKTITNSASPALNNTNQEGSPKKRSDTSQEGSPKKRSDTSQEGSPKKRSDSTKQTLADKHSLLKKRGKKKKKKIKGDQPAILSKKKKKKMSIKIESKSGDKDIKTLDSRQLQRQLSKVMSASRLSKFGIGPNAVKIKKKKKKTKVNS